MNRTYRPLAGLTSRELQRRAMEYRRMALAARGQNIASALDRLAIRFALLAAGREVDEARQIQHTDNDPRDQEQSEITKLISLVEQSAANEPDPVSALADAIRTVAEGSADPYLVMGVLIEGAIYTLETRIPDERQEDAAAALLHLVTNRLRASGKPDEPRSIG